MQIACDETKWDAFMGRTLHLARTEDSGGIAIEQQTQQHFRRIRRPTPCSIPSIQAREVKLCHTVDDEAGQMARRQTVSQPDFQLQRLLIVGPFKFSAHTSSLLGPPNQAALFSLRQTARKRSISFACC